MSHKHKHISHHAKISGSREWLNMHKNTLEGPSAQGTKPKLEFVLKCDSAGSVEAVSAGVLKIVPPEADINIIHSGIGYINESDILVAETGSRLIAGFQVGVLPGIDRELKEHAVEARLYDVIYKLTDDIKSISESIIPPVTQEEILGTARVIALFKSCRKGTIIGCEVMNGHLAVGKDFRIISAIGPVYAGKIESVHIEKNAVQNVHTGQKAGIKIKDFNKVKIGDIVESYHSPSLKKARSWHPTGGIIRIV
jgi:translation initiation factor IF-2